MHLIRRKHKLDVRSELLGSRFRDADNLAPVQLAAATGGRCTQKPVPATEPITKEPELVDFAKADRADFLLSFALKLHEEVSWEFGGIRRVWYPVTQLLEGWKATEQDEHLSCLHVVCNNDAAGPHMLCPDGGLDFVPGALRFEWVRWLWVFWCRIAKKPDATFEADEEEEDGEARALSLRARSLTGYLAWACGHMRQSGAPLVTAPRRCSNPAVAGPDFLFFKLAGCKRAVPSARQTRCVRTKHSCRAR